jgi:hypothetical protein
VVKIPPLSNSTRRAWMATITKFTLYFYATLCAVTLIALVATLTQAPILPIRSDDNQWLRTWLLFSVRCLRFLHQTHQAMVKKGSVNITCSSTLLFTISWCDAGGGLLRSGYMPLWHHLVNRWWPKLGHVWLVCRDLYSGIPSSLHIHRVEDQQRKHCVARQ